MDELGLRLHRPRRERKYQPDHPHEVHYSAARSLLRHFQHHLLYWLHVGHELHAVFLDAERGLRSARVNLVLPDSYCHGRGLPHFGSVRLRIPRLTQNLADELPQTSGLKEAVNREPTEYEHF